MTALGLPDFGPVQQNVSFNDSTGVNPRASTPSPGTSSVSVATGRIFGAWVDLREGDSFGPGRTVGWGFDTCRVVPARGGQRLPDAGTVPRRTPTWSTSTGPRPRARRTPSSTSPIETVAVPVADPARAGRAVRRRPPLTPGWRTSHALPSPQGGAWCWAPAVRWVTGADAALLPRRGAPLTRTELDLTVDPGSRRVAYDWDARGTWSYNAAAHTAVDAAETAEGRRAAWAVNVDGRRPSWCEVARQHRLTLVHVSTDYVFDGTRELHDEDEPMSPLGVYGQSKAAGDALVSTLPRHFIIRTSWVVGDGKNFIATMASLADREVSPSVIDDQRGRLSFAEDLARAAVHLTTLRGARRAPTTSPVPGIR